MTTDTLGTMSAGDWLSAYCAPCGRHVKLDIPALVAKLGPDYPVTGVWRLVRCSQCGRRGKMVRGHDHIQAMEAKR